MVLLVMTSLMNQAIELGGQGYPVFPLRGKRPLPGSRGFKDARRDSRVIEAMPWHLANAVGIACGGGDARLLVLDLDADKSGTTPLGQSLALVRLNHLPLTTHTRRVRTPGGGMHLYVRLASDGLPLPTSRTDVLATKAKDGVALDVRCAGGYVVAYDAQQDCNYPLSALPIVERSALGAAGIVPLPNAALVRLATGRAGANQTGVSRKMRNPLSEWRRVALEAVRQGGIPLASNDAFLSFTSALASAVREEGHALNDVLAIFHEIASQFPNYEPHREEVRFLSFTRPDYAGSRPGFGTLAFHAEAARVAAIASVPMTPAVRMIGGGR